MFAINLKVVPNENSDIKSTMYSTFSNRSELCVGGAPTAAFYSGPTKIHPVHPVHPVTPGDTRGHPVTPGDTRGLKYTRGEHPGTPGGKDGKLLSLNCPTADFNTR